MTTRDQTLTVFLQLAGWGRAKREPLAGDASNRRYERLNDPQLGPAVLMDAPPETGEDTRPFIKIAAHLSASGLSAPKILARDAENGFLILEDLGDDLFARFLEQHPDQERTLYIAAIDALIAAQQPPPPTGLETYGVAEMTQTALLAADWYQRFADPEARSIRADLEQEVARTLKRALNRALKKTWGQELVLVQRDYHAENLLWLPERATPANVGLLDFQDAMLGHPAYDLASLLKDARRDVGAATQNAALAHFLDKTGLDGDAFSCAYAACSAQRNLRILGVFARLSVRDGKRHYPDLLPRVWRNLQDDLAHPTLAALRSVVAALPTPSAAIIDRLKAAHV